MLIKEGKKIQCFTLVAQIIEIHAHEFPRSTHNIFQHHNGRAVVFHLRKICLEEKKINNHSISLYLEEAKNWSKTMKHETSPTQPNIPRYVRVLSPDPNRKSCLWLFKEDASLQEVPATKMST